MTAIFKRMFSFLKPELPPLQIFILGLDNAGKTTFLNYLKINEFTSPHRTYGINLQLVKLDGIQINIADLGGQDTFRTTLWPKFIEQKADAILYIIDATDRDRLLANEEEFSILLNHPNLRDASIIVLANKQDLPAALGPGEIALQLKLPDYALQNPRNIRVFPTSMKTGAGIDEVTNYLKEIYLDKNKTKN